MKQFVHISQLQMVHVKVYFRDNKLHHALKEFVLKHQTHIKLMLNAKIIILVVIRQDRDAIHWII